MLRHRNQEKALGGEACVSWRQCGFLHLHGVTGHFRGWMVVPELRRQERHAFHNRPQVEMLTLKFYQVICLD